MKGVLNEVTNTVHRPRGGESGVRTACGAGSRLPDDRLTAVAAVESKARGTDVSKCGRCFDDGGGY